MNCFLEPYTRSKNKIYVKIDLSNNLTKSDLKNATGFNTPDFPKKA